MDSPEPLEDAASVSLRPNITPNSDVHASPVPVPPHKNKPRGGRRGVIQRAKPSFIDENDTSDDEEEHVDGEKPPSTHRLREVTRRNTDFANFPKGFKTKTSNQVPELDTHPGESVVLDVNKVDSRAASVSAPELELIEGSDGFDERMGQGIVINTSTAASPHSHEQKKGMTCALRGSSTIDVDGPEQGWNSPGKRLPVSNTKVKPPALGLEVEGSDDNDQHVNTFSLSALPPSTGNSPVAIKTERKTANKKRTTKEPGKQSRKQAAKEVAKHRKNPNTGQSKAQRAVPIDRSLEPSSNVEDDKNNAMIGLDLQEKQELGRPSMPRQANFKPLKSPVNTHLDATQDLIYINSDESDDFGDDDDVEDDVFVPTSSRNPVKDKSSHPKTRAATQHGADRDASKCSNAPKARAVDRQRHEEEKKLVKVASSDGMKPMALSKMASKAAADKNTRFGETKAKPMTQLKETAHTTAVQRQTKEASTVLQSANFRTSGSNGKSKQNTVRPSPMPVKSRKTRTGGLDKLWNAHQADEDPSDHPRNPDIIAFGQDGPKNPGKLRKPANSPVRRSPGRLARLSAGDELPSTTNSEPVTTAHGQWKQRATKSKTTGPSTSCSNSSDSKTNTPRYPAPRQDVEDDENLVPVAETHEEDGAPNPVYEDQTRSGERLVSATYGDSISAGHETTASDEAIFEDTDERDGMGLNEPPAVNASSVVLPDNDNKQQRSAHEHKTAVVPQEKIILFNDIFATAIRHDRSAAGPKTLKRRLPEDIVPCPTADATNRASGIKPCSQSSSSKPMRRPHDLIAPSMDMGPVAKKQRFEVVHSTSNSQDEKSVSGPAASHIRARDSSDDVFYLEKQGEPVKRTAFVRNCIDNEPSDHGATRFEAIPMARKLPVGHSSPTNHRRRARTLQQPDSVAKRVLAAISAPEANANMPPASNHDTGLSSVQAKEQIPNVDDRRTAWKKATEPYGDGIAEIMHKIVNVILRGLKTKEDAVNDVVGDYESEGRRVVGKLSSEHEKEREKLIQQYEQYRTDYIKVCTEARHLTKATSKDLKSVDLGRIMTAVGRDPAVDRLKELQKTLQKAA